MEAYTIKAEKKKKNFRICTFFIFVCILLFAMLISPTKTHAQYLSFEIVEVLLEEPMEDLVATLIENEETGLLLETNLETEPATEAIIEAEASTTTDLALNTEQNQTTQTSPTDLPIDITAIGRGEQAEIILSLRFFDLDLFSANSQRLNEAIAKRQRINQAMLEESMFVVFEVPQIMDADERTVYAANNLNLFAQPANFGRIGQTQVNDEIPLWLIITILSLCAALGIVLAKVFVQRKARGS